MCTERTSVCLDVHAWSISEAALDTSTGELGTEATQGMILTVMWRGQVALWWLHAPRVPNDPSELVFSVGEIDLFGPGHNQDR